jgi:hypothetical protein
MVNTGPRTRRLSPSDADNREQSLNNIQRVCVRENTDLCNSWVNTHKDE